MDTKSDSLNQWSNRKDFAANLIKFYDVDICGAQEVLHNQLVDLIDRLPDFDYVGVGREDGKTKGEYSPIFYNTKRFEVLKSGNFWLAEDLNIPGKKGWDAACERVATWVIFKDKSDKQSFFVINTHLDHMGKVARHEGASLLLKQIELLAGKLPIILTGDFNAKPEDDPIQVLLQPSNHIQLKHTRDLAVLKYGPEWTFHNFGRVPLDKRDWIDYIFVNGAFNVLKNGVITDTLNQLYPSDHCPVLVTLMLN